MSIHIGAYEDDPSRFERLDLLRRLLELHRYYFCERDAHVLAIYDHKGGLAVNWSAAPDQEQQKVLDELWEHAFFEPLTDHFVLGEQITDNCDWCGNPWEWKKNHRQKVEEKIK